GEERLHTATYDTPVPRVLLVLPSATYRAPDFLDAAARLGAEVVVGSEHRQALSDSMGDRAVTLTLSQPEMAADQIERLSEPDPLDGPYFEETIYVTPSRKPDAVQREIERVTAEAAAALGLTQGPVHAELRLAPEPTVLELAARSIGGLCSRSLRFGLGVSL